MNIENVHSNDMDILDISIYFSYEKYIIDTDVHEDFLPEFLGQSINIMIH